MERYSYSTKDDFDTWNALIFENGDFYSVQHGHHLWALQEFFPKSDEWKVAEAKNVIQISDCQVMPNGRIVTQAQVTALDTWYNKLSPDMKSHVKCMGGRCPNFETLLKELADYGYL